MQILAPSLDLSASPAQSGLLRLPNNQWLEGRNAAGSADVNLLRLNSSNLLETGAGLVVAGNLLANTDATYDFGASGASRFRDGYLSRNFVLGGSLGAGVAAESISYTTPGTYSTSTPLHVKNPTTVLTGAGSAGYTQLLATFEGLCGNTVRNRLWLKRQADGTTYTTIRLHDAVSVDSSFRTPGTDTKCWYERDPNGASHIWGNAATTYATLGSQALTLALQLIITSTSPEMRLYKTGLTAPDGLWRWTVGTSGEALLQRNTDAAMGFATAVSTVQIDTADKVTLSGALRANGIVDAMSSMGVGTTAVSLRRLTVKNSTADNNAWGVSVYDSNSYEVWKVDGRGRVDAYWPANDGAIYVLNNAPSAPANGDRAGHYAFAALNGNLGRHTINTFEGYITNITATAMDSRIRWGFMDAVNGEPGGVPTYQQPNVYCTLDKAGLDLKGYAYLSALKTQTASLPLLDTAQQWNGSSVTFTLHRAKVYDQASKKDSLLFDYQVSTDGINYKSAVSASKDGTLYAKAFVGASFKEWCVQYDSGATVVTTVTPAATNILKVGISTPAITVNGGVTVRGTMNQASDATGIYINYTSGATSGDTAGWLFPSTAPTTPILYYNLNSISTFVAMTGPNATDVQNCRIWVGWFASDPSASDLPAVAGFGFRFSPTVVGAVTVTGAGSGYSAIPTITPSGGTPSTAATFQAYMGVDAATVVAGGANYTVGDVIAVVGGTSRITATLTVSAVTAGVITAVTVANAGSFSALPAGTVTTTIVSATSARAGGGTFTLTYKVVGVNVTNPGAGYASAPTLAFSTGAATATTTLGGKWHPFQSNGTTPTTGLVDYDDTSQDCVFNTRYVLRCDTTSGLDIRFSINNKIISALTTSMTGTTSLMAVCQLKTTSGVARNFRVSSLRVEHE